MAFWYIILSLSIIYFKILHNLSVSQNFPCPEFFLLSFQTIFNVSFPDIRGNNFAKITRWNFTRWEGMPRNLYDEFLFLTSTFTALIDEYFVHLSVDGAEN